MKTGIINRLRKPSVNATCYVYKYLKSNKKVMKILYRRYLIKHFGIFVPEKIKIGEQLRLPHPNGIIFGNNVSIGNEVTIYQQVTIGGQNVGDTINGRSPRIGNNVIIYSGAKILGDITVSDKCIIGANAVVIRDTEENGVYAGVPARRIR